MDWRCERCKLPLIHSDEIEFGLCDGCAEAAYENERARAEWGEYHPGEPCPDIELPHPPRNPNRKP